MHMHSLSPSLSHTYTHTLCVHEVLGANLQGGRLHRGPALG